MATIQGVYMALFGRPADPAGLSFFSGVTNNGQNLAGIGPLQAQPEFTSRFAGDTNAEIITAIYQSLFNRDPDATGRTFFAGELAAGRQTVNTIAINILDGARGSDLTVLNTKLAAANAFTAAIDTTAEITGYSGTTAAESAAGFIKGISTTAPTAAQVAAAVSAAVGSGPVQPVDERSLDAREAGYYDGQDNNTTTEHIAWNSSDGFNYRDVVYGDGGYDYISTGGGNDKIVLGSNAGTWRGEGNEFGNAAIADAGSGNDDIYVRGSEGAFHVILGQGQDDVFVTGATQAADYLRINAYDDDTLVDTFTFGPAFNGDAVIWGADDKDLIKLEGGDWSRASTADGVTYANSTGGSVWVTGVTYNYNDPDVIFA